MTIRSDGVGDAFVEDGDASTESGATSVYDGGNSAEGGEVSVYDGGRSAVGGDASVDDGDRSAAAGDASECDGGNSAGGSDVSVYGGDRSAVGGDSCLEADVVRSCRDCDATEITDCGVGAVAALSANSPLTREAGIQSGNDSFHISSVRINSPTRAMCFSSLELTGPHFSPF